MQFKAGDDISVFAKKAIRRNEGKIFEAIGNAVIIHGEETLYGHAAKFDVEKGLFEINGNVRYITKDLTLYGSYLNYSTKDGKMLIDNARLITPGYRIVARKVRKVGVNDYIAEEAEFTTCKDCTESWTVYGEKVFVTTNQYVRVRNALLRVKGADFFYLPYVIFPIKNERETGVLFPTISTSGDFSYAQPWFWAINQSTDMTLTPTIWASEGWGGDVEFRKAINSRSFIEFDGRYVRDKYLLREENEVLDRYLVDSEVNYQWGYGNNFYTRISDMSDLSFPLDHNDFAEPHLNSTEYGIEGFFNSRSDSLDYGVEYSVKKSLLQNDPLYYDDFFDLRDNQVQTLPRLHMGMAPKVFFKANRNFLNLMYISGRFDANHFKQNDFDEGVLRSGNLPLRNAQRLNIVPIAHLSLYDNGIFSLSSEYEADMQYYDFREDWENSFRKYSGVLATKLSFGFEKVYGLAYKEEVPRELEETDEDKNSSDKDEESKNISVDSELVGGLEDFTLAKAKNTEEVVFKSYKHSQEINIIHRDIPSEREYGNKNFLDQIGQDSNRFDFFDAIRSQEYLSTSELLSTQIPYENTLEFQWNHTFLSKTPKNFDYNEDGRLLNDNFNYSRQGYLNISQGIVLENDNGFNSFNDRLTRLAINSGVSFSPRFTLGLSEYYFHQTRDHLLNVSLRNYFDYFRIYNLFEINELQDDRIHNYGIDFQLTNEIYFGLFHETDLDDGRNISRRYALHYTPPNDCWLISFTYQKTSHEDIFGIYYNFNFGNPQFHNQLKRVF